MWICTVDSPHLMYEHSLRQDILTVKIIEIVTALRWKWWNNEHAASPDSKKYKTVMVIFSAHNYDNDNDNDNANLKMK